MEEYTFTKYEQARIIGARALQIAMNAPLLIKITKDDLEKIKFDALKIAEIEFNSGVLPINVRQPLPQKREDALKRVKEVKAVDKELEEQEAKEEEEIAKEGEIMELASSDEDAEEDTTDSGSDYE